MAMKSTANNSVVTLYGDGNYTSCGEHFIMYINVKSLCCIPETNKRQLYLNKNF